MSDNQTIKISGGNALAPVLRPLKQIWGMCDGRADSAAHSITKSLKMHICGKISSFCADVSDGADERIYDRYRKLMRGYAEIAARRIGSADAVSNREAASILDGIYAVAVSRLSVYDENQAHENDINPIFLEKKEIAAERIKAFSSAFDKIFAGFYAGSAAIFKNGSRRAMIRGADYNGALALFQNAADGICAAILRPVYDEYRAALKHAAACVNDLGSRKVLRGYTEILRQEAGILNDIIDAQLPALDSLLRRDISEDEKNVISGFVFTINGMWEDFNGESAGLSAFFGAAGEPPSAYEYYGESGEESGFAEFAEEARDAVKAENYVKIQEIDDFNEKLSAKVNKFTELIIKNIAASVSSMSASTEFTSSFSQRKYQMSAAVYGETLMADEMRAVFRELNDIYKQNSEVLQSNAIIAGIDETIMIKDEALAEAKENFLTETRETLKNLDDMAMPPDEAFFAETVRKSDHIGGLTDELLAGLCDNENGASEDIIIRFSRETADKIFYDYAGKINRTADKLEESVKNKSLRFKKEHLLQEMITFDEILYYSVTRLRETESEEAEKSGITEYIQAIDAADEKLIEILRKNNIEIINPKPHDAFNGKEHEILIAEADAEFKKGEIIKPMNNGYRYEGTVLIRANVIAAK